MKFSTIATMFVTALTLNGCEWQSSSDDYMDEAYLQAFERYAAQMQFPKATALFYSQSEDAYMSQDQLLAFERSIGRLESGNNYYAVSAKPNPIGFYNVGRYQVMENMVPQMTEATLGIRVQPWDYLANPSLQDLVFDLFVQTIHEHTRSTEDCAAIWFSGQPLHLSFYKRSGNGFTVSRYVDIVMNNM